MDMGITKGSELYIRKVAPLGDPVEITVRGYELSVRKKRRTMRSGEIDWHAAQTEAKVKGGIKEWQ